MTRQPGDKPATAPVSRGVANRLAQLSQAPPGGFQLQSKKRGRTARFPKLSFLHIKILISSICKKLPRVRGSA